MTSIGAPELLLIIPFALLGIGGFVLWILALVDAVRVPDDSMYRAGTKVTWGW
jgi:hypothetical protein